MAESRLLPLFPLATVLFPSALLPLHVFEERYRLLVRRCLAADRAIGIILIRSGWEVGEAAVPYEVGTLARLTRVDARSDDTFEIAVVGERRFRVKCLVPGQPYQQAEVELLADEPAEVPEELVDGVRHDFLTYLRSIRQTARVSREPLHRPNDPLELSYVIAAHLAVPLWEKQELLEVALAPRLEQERRLLRRETVLLQRLGAAPPRRAPSPKEISAN